MKWLISFFVVLLGFVPALATGPHDESKVIKAYAQFVFSSYQEAAIKAQQLQVALDNFIENPNALSLHLAKEKWVEARTAYSPTEVFRFYGGPIDDDDGPEGSLNAWPLDEAYIDYVEGAAQSGLIQDLVNFPVLTADLLRDLNEKEGEKNITTGFHAIEFLLWGQDLSTSGPGARPIADFVSAKFADRRREYLKILGEILVEDLESVREEWDLNSATSYASEFVKSGEEKESLRKIFLSLYSLAAEELAQERIYVAYDTQLEEDEQSCFSDMTHLDIYYNFMGIAHVWEIVLPLVKRQDERLAVELSQQLASLEQQALHFPSPFDQAIVSAKDRPIILKFVRDLEKLGELTRTAASRLGLAVP